MSNSTEPEMTPTDPAPAAPEDGSSDPIPPGKRRHWQGCLIAVLVMGIILGAAGWFAWRTFSPSGKRMVAAVNPDPQANLQLPEGLNLRIPKGLTPTPTSTPSLTPPPTLSPTPIEVPSITPSPTPEPAFTWKTQVLQSTLAIGAFTSLKIDSQGFLHMLYFQDNNDGVWYAQNTGGDWQFEFIQGEVGHGFHLSLALDSQGQPHMVYNNIQSKQAKPYMWYRWHTPSGWSSRFREADYTALNSDVSIALDPAGMPYFSYQSAYDASLMVASFDPKVGITSQKVGDASDNCHSLPLVVDSNGDPHVCFCASQGLVYAYRQGGNWHQEVVDPKPETGTYADLALDTQGRAHIAYYDPGYGILNYARRTESGWQIQEVDTDEDTGRFPSIAVDPQGGVHISYYDVTRAALRYAYWNGEAWELLTVDRKGDVGRFNSLVLDPLSGEPRISYFDASKEDLKLAWATRR